jgi:chemotaxis protein CheY-P-specific phosphatase CheC
VAVAIPFYGSRQGTLLLAASRQLGAVLAGNILGTDPSDPEAQQKAMDALRELANITCGLWLRKTAEDSGGKCEMQVPECHDISTPEEWQKLVGTAAGVLDAEGFLVATVVNMAA